MMKGNADIMGLSFSGIYLLDESYWLMQALTLLASQVADEWPLGKLIVMPADIGSWKTRVA